MSSLWGLQSEPATPPAGFLRLWVEGNSLKYKNPSGTVYTLSTGVSAEEVEDIVAALVQDTGSIQWTYNDAGDQLSAVVLASGVNHNALQNYVSNEHINHTSVNINAGTGLTGGGNIAASRTLNLADTSVSPGTYGVSGVPQFTVDQQGRITNAVDGPPLVLGDNSAYFEDLVSASTSGTALIAASDIFAYGVRPIGTYRYKLNLKIEPNSTSNDYIFELRANGITLQEIREEGKDASAQQRHSREIFGWIYSPISVDQNWQVFFATESGGTLVLHEARLELWRVSPLDLT